jgi:galactose mutarotase-like enzyme
MNILTVMYGRENMRYCIENETLRVEIDSHGAEIKSVRRKSDNREYMWHGDSRYWGRTSPVLFPFVGSVRNKEYRFEGKTYPMGQHGFARDMEFEPAPEQGNCAPGVETMWFALESCEETLEKYPFPFRLEIGYELSESEIKVLWRVKNPAEKPMYFSIGAHPAFLCPINGETDEAGDSCKLGYGLHFKGLTKLQHHGNTPDGMAVMENQTLPLENGCVYFTPGFFDKCTYMAEGKQTGEVSLLDRQGNAYVTVIFDTPLFAVWSPEGKNAPFVCIEPWYGRCDAQGFTGSLEERDYEQTLAAGAEFAAEYRMIFDKAVE